MLAYLWVVCCFLFFFCFKQKTAYEMRISDWSQTCALPISGQTSKARTMRKIDTNKANYVGLDQRLSPRSDVYCRLPFVLPDGRQEMCTCVNISADGLLMRYGRGLEPGDLVIFRMPIVGRITAKVIWSLGGKAGVQFDRLNGVED